MRGFPHTMRAILFAALLLAACSGGGDEGQNKAAPPAPRPTGPAPRTPVTQGVTPEAGNEAGWMEPSSNAGDPTTAPYGQGLDAPLVNAADR